MKPFMRVLCMLVCALIVAELMFSTVAMIIAIATVGLVLLAATKVFWRKALVCEQERIFRLTLEAFKHHLKLSLSEKK